MDQDTKCSSTEIASLPSPFLTPSKDRMRELIFKELPSLGYIYHWIQNNKHLFHNEVVGPIAAEIIPKSEDAADFLYLHVCDNIALKAFIVQGKKDYDTLYANIRKSQRVPINIMMLEIGASLDLVHHCHSFSTSTLVMKVLSSRITTEEPADIRDLLMAFQETLHDEDSSSSDVWPETMDSNSLDNDVTGGTSDLILATHEEIGTLGDVNMNKYDNDRKESVEEKMKQSSETLKPKGDFIYLDSSVTTGGLLTVDDSDDDRKESVEEKIERLATFQLECDNRCNFLDERQTREDMDSPKDHIRNETPEQKKRLETLKRKRDRRKIVKGNEKPGQRIDRKKKDADGRLDHKGNETPVQRTDRLKKDADRYQDRLQKDTPGQNTDRIKKRTKQDADRYQDLKQNETAGQTTDRKKQNAASRRDQRQNETPGQSEVRKKRDVAGHQNYFQNQTPEETRHRKKKAKASHKERTENGTPEEQKHRIEVNKASQKKHREETKAKDEKKREEEVRKGLHDDWNISAEKLFSHLDEINEKEKLQQYFADIENNPLKAVLLYYLNSGYGRFHQYKEFDKASEGKDVDVDSICEEIEEEILDETDLFKLLKSFFEAHSYTDSKLLNCGACGLREMDSVKYFTVPLADLSILLYNVDAHAKLQSLKDKGSLIIPLEGGRQAIVHPHNVISYYETNPQSNIIYHLHGELVETSDDGSAKTMLCPTCYKKIVKQGVIPKLSVAGGVDFGFFKRIPELTEPNLHEQLVLSQFRLFQAILKVVPNFKYQQNYTRFNIKANAILFLQDAPKQVKHLIEDPEYLKNLLRVYMLDEKGKADAMAKKFFNTSKLLARGYVVTQWLLLLDRVNMWFGNGYSKIMRITEAVNESVEEIKKDTRVIHGTDDLRMELILGSDVAMAQQVDASIAETVIPSEQDQDDEIPLRYNFVTPRGGMSLEKDDVQTRVLLNAAEEVLFGKEEHTSDVSNTGIANDGDIQQHCENGENLPAHFDDNEHWVNSYRSSTPHSEFDSTDKLLGATFPHVFLLGTAYKRSIGSLNVSQRNHLLKQFTNVPASNRRLLGYLQDTKKRHQVLQGVKGQIYGNAKAVRKVMDLLNDGETKKLFVMAKQNPSSPTAKKLIKELLPLLNVGGRDVSYGAVEGRMSLSRSIEMCKRYGPGSVFLTLAFDDIHNPRAIRASYNTVDNTKFPSVFELGGKHGNNGKEYMKKLRQASTLIGEGTILLDGTPVDKEHTRSVLASRAMDNPVAYVNESKSLINDILSILLGLPPENFFGGMESKTVRKVRYFKSRGKGVFGFTLAFNGTVEDHVKGTLHYHLILYGSIPPYLLQRFANIRLICQSISKALDSMFRAKLPTNVHVRHMIHRILRANNNLGLKSTDLDLLTVNAILDKEEPLQRVQIGENKSSHAKIHEETANHGAKNHYHCHCATCRKGLNGYMGCRLSKPSGECDETKPVELLPLVPTNEHLTGKQTYDYEVQQVPEVQNIQYETWNPIESNEKKIIVWELHRPKECIGKDIIDNMDGRLEEDVREDILSTFKECLENDPSYDDISKLWTWLAEVPFDQLSAFFQEFVKQMDEANGYVVDHCPLLLYCMGSHHNALILGGSEQAKAAMFYISPYISKGKVDLATCLSILEDARKEIEKYPSKAEDTETNPRRRKAQHFLTRTLNKMNAYIEMSDYQVAADLLNLPCMICSDIFGYFNPQAYMAYLLHLQANEDEEKGADQLFTLLNDHRDMLEREQNHEANIQDGLNDFIVNDDQMEDSDGNHSEDGNNKEERIAIDQEEFYHSFGAIRLYTLERSNNEEGQDVKQAIPLVANYSNRGSGLAKLSRSEYDALIQIKPRRSSLQTSSFHIRSKQFLFYEGFSPHGNYAQFLRAKQRTLIYYAKGPRHPGKQPHTEITSKQYKNWKRKADKFASFYLIAFRPEPECFNGNHHNALTYDWNALQQWIIQLQQDDSVLSKFRLQAIHNRLHGLDADYKTKVITTMYRARNRTIWNDTEKARFNKESLLESLQKIDHDFDEFEFEQNNTELKPHVTKNMEIQLQDDCLQAKTVKRMFRVKTRYDWLAPTHFQNLTFDVAELDLQSRFTMIIDKEVLPEPMLENATAEQTSCSEDNYDDDVSSIDTCDMSTESKASSLTQATYPNLQNDSPPDPTLGLNQKQKECFQVFQRYLENLGDSKALPPEVTLLTGAAGTGKSHVILAIDTYAKQLGIPIIKTAFNNINAIDLDGPTLSKVAYLHGASNAKLEDISASKIKLLAEEYGHKLAKLIIVDEVSNVMSFAYARLDQVCKIATGNHNQYFGGIPILLVGDFNQKGPVKNDLITTSLMSLIKHKKNCERDLNNHPISDFDMARFGGQHEAVSTRHTSSEQPHSFHRQKNIGSTSDAIHSKSKFRNGSPFRVGCEIFASARWIQLTEQQRSKDDQHTAFIVKMSQGQTITTQDINQYKVLSETDFRFDNSKWHTAPIIVRTNRERHTLNHIRCLNYAKSKKTVVVRWLAKYGYWEQKPASEEHINTAMQDPAFYEYFVQSAPGYCIHNLCKPKKIANGTRIQYHSLSLSDNQTQLFKLKLSNAKAGDIIELEEPPLSVNICLIQEETNKKNISRWRHLTLIPGRVIIPILQQRSDVSGKKPLPIPGGLLYKPSKVRIAPAFPLELAFAIVVDKAQGQTIKRVIVALSERRARSCQMDYESVYVANSRVKKNDHLRLLLSGLTPARQWQSVEYISTLRPQKSVKAFFSGYSEDRSDWKNDVFNENKAFSTYNLR